MIEVVIPAYNAGRFLRETLHSVAAQSARPDLVTVVDDASTDDTVGVARACAAELSGLVDVRILRNAGPRGPSAARNTAIARSGATHIALLDADDLLEPGHHATLLRALRAADGAVLAFADSTVFSETATLVPSLFAVSGVAALPAEEVAPDCFTLGQGTFAALLGAGVFCTSACMFRRDAALAVGLFDETMMHGEDTDLFLRLALAGGFMFSRRTVTRKRVHGQNLTDPKNKLAFCRGTALSLAKLAAGSEGAPPAAPPLSAAQRAALLEMLPRALDGYLYNASCAGASAYWQAARLAARTGRATMAAKPRHLARLVLWRLLKTLQLR